MDKALLAVRPKAKSNSFLSYEVGRHLKKQKYNIRSMMNPDILSTRVREEGKSAKYGRNNFGVGTITGGLLHTTNVP